MWFKHTGGVGPEERGAEQEPIDVGVQAAGVEGPGAVADEADEAREAADDESGQEDLLEEVQQHG